MRQHIWPVIICASWLISPLARGENLPVEIKPTDPNILYQGRWDTTDAAGPRCAYTASGIIVRFKGTAIGAKMKEGWAGNNQDQLEPIVDGKSGAVVKLKAGEETVTLAEGLPNAEHTL